MKTCETCRYFQSIIGEEKLGQCLRFPPIFDSKRPTVSAMDYCGEYLPKIKQIKGASERVPTTSTAKRIADLYGRRHTTPWSEKEIRAFKALMPIAEADLSLVERLYKSGDKFARKSLLTFLNNFLGEVDRAKGLLPKARPAIEKTDPQGWVEWLAAKGYSPIEYANARGYMKDEFNAEKK